MNYDAYDLATKRWLCCVAAGSKHEAMRKAHAVSQIAVEFIRIETTEGSLIGITVKPMNYKGWRIHGHGKQWTAIRFGVHMSGNSKELLHHMIDLKEQAEHRRSLSLSLTPGRFGVAVTLG
jgi:hypothetical protein